MENTKEYLVTLADDHGMVSYVKTREEVVPFINGINWEVVRSFSVEPVEQLADWERELLDHDKESEVVEERTFDV